MHFCRVFILFDVTTFTLYVNELKHDMLYLRISASKRFSSNQHEAKIPNQPRHYSYLWCSNLSEGKIGFKSRHKKVPLPGRDVCHPALLHTHTTLNTIMHVFFPSQGSLENNEQHSSTFLEQNLCFPSPELLPRASNFSTAPPIHSRAFVTKF